MKPRYLWTAKGAVLKYQSICIAIGQRLREERKRIGLTLPSFSAIGGAQKNSQLAYEKGVRTPPLLYLARLEADAGIDVLYVITGRREKKADGFEPNNQGDTA